LVEIVLIGCSEKWGFDQSRMSLFVSAEKDENVIVELENIQKTYLLGIEGVPALRGVSLKIYRGEFVIIYGTSGGGKTSLLNIIGTIDKPTKGRLTIAGTRIVGSTQDSVLADLRLKRMGFVFQTFNLLSTMNAIQNVEMPMILRGNLGQKDRRERAKMLLEKVGMGARLDHLPSQLSGGEQQRVTIARALSNKPDILLLDEPTGDLDSKNTLIVMDMLCRLNEEEGITCIMVTHDPNLKHLATRIVQMRDGKIAKLEQLDPKATAAARQGVRDQIDELSGKSIKVGSGKKFTEVRRPKDYETYHAEGVEKANGILAELKDHENVKNPPTENETVILLPKKQDFEPQVSHAINIREENEIENVKIN
jgi:putative ABC transport system ATP-binding protein